MSLVARDVFVRANGLRHHLVERGSPGSLPVIVIPGLTQQARVFDRLATQLAQASHVYTWDLRGRGDSDWGPADEYHMNSYVADLDSVREALGLERASLVGSHMGGSIAMYYASRHPEHTERVVVSDMAPTLDRAGVRKMWGRAAAAPTSFADLESVVRYYREAYPGSAGALSNNAIVEYVGWQVRQVADGTYLWKMDPAVRNGMARPEGIEDPWQMFRAIRVSVLLIRGDQSELVSEEIADRMVREGRDCRVAVIPGLVHAPSLMEPEATAALGSFLNETVADITTSDGKSFERNSFFDIRSIGASVDSVQAITTLVYRYCELIDSGDFDAYVKQFEHGSMGGRAKGDTASLRQWITDNMVLHDGSPCTRHLMNNLIVEVDEAADTAKARSYVTVLHTAPGQALAIVGTAQYHDQFERVGGTWRWAERVVVNSLSGDSSRHTRGSS